MSDNLNQDIRDAMAAQTYEQLKDHPAIKQYVAMGGLISPQDAKSAGWDEEKLERINSAIAYGQKMSGSKGLEADLVEGFQNSGMSLDRAPDSAHGEVLEVRAHQ